MTRTNPEQSSVARGESTRTGAAPAAAWARPARRAPRSDATIRKSMRTARWPPASGEGILRLARRGRERLLPDDLAPRVQLVAGGERRLDLGGVALHVPARV